MERMGTSRSCPSGPARQVAGRHVVGQPDAVGGLVEGVAGRVHGRGVHRQDDGRLAARAHRDALGIDALSRTGEPTLRDLSEALITVYGTDYGIHSPTWISRFTDMTRQAASYRKGRVLLAGDAAHVHYPVGGQGLNTSVQDAVNLGWKLTKVVSETSPEGLLDTYHAEQHR